MKVLILAPEFGFDDIWRIALRNAMPDVVLYEIGEVDPSEVELAIVYNPPPNVLCDYLNLHAIITLSAGADVLLLDKSLPDVPIIRLTSPEITSLMREYVVYHVLRLHRRFAIIEKQNDKKEWRWMPGSIPASQRNVSILGLGMLGKACAIALSQLGFKVSGWSKSIKNIPEIDCYFGEAGLAMLLPQTEILICLLPLTKSTRNILSMSIFNQLPIGASLINVSRGGCLNEEDLLLQLDSGKIAHATLDVFNTEPLPKLHPFWNHSSVTITPHIAADANPNSSAYEIAKIIYRINNKQPLINVISRINEY